MTHNQGKVLSMLCWLSMLHSKKLHLHFECCYLKGGIPVKLFSSFGVLHLSLKSLFLKQLRSSAVSVVFVFNASLSPVVPMSPIVLSIYNTLLNRPLKNYHLGKNRSPTP